MNWKHVAGALVVMVIIALAIGAAYWTGFGPAPGGSGTGDPITDFPTQTLAPEGTAANGTVATGDETVAATATPGSPFAFTIDDIEECGLTCRDVTATLYNTQDEAATGVTVFSRIYAGQDSTAESDLLWQGKEPVGTLEAGATYTSTRRVELSLGDATAIEGAGGWVTIVTTVQSDERTVTFRDDEQVA